MSRNMHLPVALRNLMNSIMDSYNRSAYGKFLKLIWKQELTPHSRRRILVTSMPCSVFNLHFDIPSELNKMKSIKHNVEKADDNIIVTSVSDNSFSMWLIKVSVIVQVQHGETMVFHADTYLFVGKMRAKTYMMKH